MYYLLHEALAEKIPDPDLLVYLRADTRTLMQRIALRDRPYERAMESNYIQELNEAYDSFFINQKHAMPVLTIESGDLDFVRNPTDLEWIENRIRQTLQLSPFQPELPLE
jgi:deoxyadenosine/deoxycytidine kinase